MAQADVSPIRAPGLSIVVTLFNEAGTIEELHRRVVEALGATDYELILVDDGSRDATWQIVERLQASDPRIRAVRFKRNFGQHPAMHAGLARAQGEIVVTMDGDLQNAPEDIPRLVAAVEAGSDVASGRRVARRDSWGRTLPSRVINGMLRRFTGVDISDFTVRVYGDTAIAAGKSESKVTINGQPQGGSLRFTRVYVRRDGRWLMIATHATRRQ